MGNCVAHVFLIIDYKNMDYLDTPIVSDNIYDHMDQSESKNGRTILMSYLQGSSTID